MRPDRIDIDEQASATDEAAAAEKKAELKMTVDDYIIEERLVFRINEIFKEVRQALLTNKKNIRPQFFANSERVSLQIFQHPQLLGIFDESHENEFDNLLRAQLIEFANMHIKFLFNLCNHKMRLAGKVRERKEEIALFKSFEPKCSQKKERKSSKNNSKLGKLDLENHNHVVNIIAAVRLTIELIRPGDRNNTGQLQGLLFGDNGAVTAGRIENFLNNKIENSPHLTRKNIIQILDILGVLSEDKTTSTVNRRYKSKSPQYRFQAEREQQIEDAEITAAIGQLLQNAGFSKEE